MPTPIADASSSAMNHGQIVMFGPIDGLIACLAAITVLLLCLQPGEFTLGATLVLCVSFSLAAVMSVTGVAAALATRHIGQRWNGFEKLARRAPFILGAPIGCIGRYFGCHGVVTLRGAGSSTR